MTGTIPAEHDAREREELRRLNAALERRVRELAERLAAAEEALARGIAERDTIIEHVAQGLTVFDGAGNVLYRNAAARRIIGIDEDAEVPDRAAFHRSFKPLRMDGTPMPPGAFPSARALRGETVEGVEMRLQGPAHAHGIICRCSAVPIRDAAGRVSRVVMTFEDVTERKHAEERQALLLAELDHRVKNMLATIQALVVQTRHHAPSPEAFIAALEGRIRAMAQAHGLVTRGRFEGTSLRAVVEQELAPYRGQGGGNVTVEGPDLVLKPKAALSLGLAMHELTTNAAKYGALSVPEGRVDVNWSIATADGGPDGGGRPALALRWAEHGGPPVSPPARRGFGRTLIERSLAYEVDGEVELGFPRGGVTCGIVVPLAELLAPAPPAPGQAGFGNPDRG